MSVPPPMGFGGNGAGGFGARSSGTGITDEADFRGHDSYGGQPHWMKFLPPKAQATMAENQDAKERMSADEYEAFQDAKRKDKNAKKMHDQEPAMLDLNRVAYDTLAGAIERFNSAPEAAQLRRQRATASAAQLRRQRATASAAAATAAKNDSKIPVQIGPVLPSGAFVKPTNGFPSPSAVPDTSRAAASAGTSGAAAVTATASVGPWRRQGRQARPADDDDASVGAYWAKQVESAAYKRMQPQRERLPAYKMRQQLIETVMASGRQVTVISGETGCGKTTQVPQFLMEHAVAQGKGSECRIICTQPRRISAIGVSDRVASERGERVGGYVGYKIRLESSVSADTRLLFCTTGVLLRQLQGDPQLVDTSIVIIDEVHERSLDSDFLLIILRDLIKTRTDLRLILMSATLNASMFSEYFGGAPMVHIPGFTFPVEQNFLEHALEVTGYQLASMSYESLGPARHGSAKYRNERRKVARFDVDSATAEVVANYGGKGLSPHTMASLAQFDPEAIPLELIVALVTQIHFELGDGAILIFLPGWEDISKMHELLEKAKPKLEGPGGAAIKLYPLHSQVPTAQQREIFNRPPAGVRKIVIATNIAESSITIEDVVFVIDSGKHKEKTYDAENNIAALLPTWVSRASATQRKGRAGRVQAGVCWHLFPSHMLAELQEYQAPEIVRTPLDQMCLQVRKLELAHPGAGGVAGFLSKAVTPPAELNVGNAVALLKTIGAFSEVEALTTLGTKLALLPLQPQIGKALIYGCLLRCLDPVVTIVSLLSSKSPFVIPLEKKDDADRAKREFARGEPSDHLAVLNAYRGWTLSKDKGAFCWKNFLSAHTLRMVLDMRNQFFTLLQDAGVLPSPTRENIADMNLFSGCWGTVKAACCAGLMPNLVRIDFGRSRGERTGKMYTKEHGPIKAHPSSVNDKERRWQQKWLFYFDKIKTLGGLFIYDTTGVSALPILLFGPGDRGAARGAAFPPLTRVPASVVTPTRGCVTLGVLDWVYFDVPGDTIGVVEETRAIFDVCAERVLSSGSRGRVPACVEAFLKEVSHSLDVSEEGAGSHNPMV